MAHFADVQIFQELLYRRDEFIKRPAFRVEVDKDKTSKHHTTKRFERDVGIAQLAFAEFLAREYVFVISPGVPTPTVKRADDIAVLKCTGTLCERGASMRTGVRVGAHAILVNPHEKH